LLSDHCTPRTPVHHRHSFRETVVRRHGLLEALSPVLRGVVPHRATCDIEAMSPSGCFPQLASFRRCCFGSTCELSCNRNFSGGDVDMLFVSLRPCPFLFDGQFAISYPHDFFFRVLDVLCLCFLRSSWSEPRLWAFPSSYSVENPRIFSYHGRRTSTFFFFVHLPPSPSMRGDCFCLALLTTHT